MYPAVGAGQAVVCSLGRANDATGDVASFLQALGRLWLAGAAVDWPGLHASARRRRVPLPTYPFERKRHWIEPPPATGSALLHQQNGEILVPVAEEDAAAPVSHPAPAPGEGALITKLKVLFHELSGTDLTRASTQASTAIQPTAMAVRSTYEPAC